MEIAGSSGAATGASAGLRPQRPFETTRLPAEPTVLAPDGSEVRVLLAAGGGSLAHFRLPAGGVSRAIEHRSVDELWYVVAGRAEMWRSQAGRDELVSLEPGVALSIPVGTRFQFRTIGDDAFAAVGVTMPPWPGAAEAVFVHGPWTGG